MQVVGSSEFSKSVNNLSKIGDYTEPIPNPGGFSILRLDIKDPARLKTFEEAKAEVSGAFQESESKRLENEYIDSLKKSIHQLYIMMNCEKHLTITITNIILFLLYLLLQVVQKKIVKRFYCSRKRNLSYQGRLCFPG